MRFPWVEHSACRVACCALVALATSRLDRALLAADRPDRHAGWSVAAAQPQLDTSQLSDATVSESLWSQPGQAVSRQRSRAPVRRRRSSTPSRSSKTDIEQRIKLEPQQREQPKKQSGRRRDTARELEQPQAVDSQGEREQPGEPSWMEDAPVEPAQLSNPSADAARPHGELLFPASHSVFHAEPGRGGSTADRHVEIASYQPELAPIENSEPYYPENEFSQYDGDYCDTYAPGCCSTCQSDPCSCHQPPRWAVGYELVLVKPRFQDNVAFTIMESDGANNDSFTEREFDYDREATTRVWMGYEFSSGLGARATYWHFDELSTQTSASPPDNGFGFILHPEFGDIDISTNIPTDTFTASSNISVFAVDLEMTKRFAGYHWSAVVSGGLRYAETEQAYQALRRQEDGAALGNIQYEHLLKGIGPTIAVRADRQLTNRLSAFTTARGSLLFGDGQSRLLAIEGPASQPLLTTEHFTGRDDLLPIGEMQVGLFWQRPQVNNRILRPFLIAALEGQVWGGTGNASSEEGSIGFFGVSLGGGATW